MQRELRGEPADGTAHELPCDAASPDAVEGLVKAMAVELAPHAIRVDAVAPTFVETPMSRPFLADPALSAHMLDSIPPGRLGAAAEVADALLLAATCELMTGASPAVDGGWTAR
jgi:NAD(P)-dependent dehydrogenase (short-subunit alcohol dehydrogenase family)